MRPQSEVRLAVAAALIDGRGSVRQLAVRTGWSVGAVRTALDNMERAGDVRVIDTQPQRGSKRWVPVYARVLLDDPAMQDDDDDTADLGRTLFSAWFQPDAALQPLREAAM